MKFWIFFKKNARTTWHWQTPGPIHGRGNFLWNSFFLKKKKKLRRWRPYPKEVDGRLKWFRCRASGFSRATASTGKREATGKKKNSRPELRSKPRPLLFHWEKKCLDRRKISKYFETRKNIKNSGRNRHPAPCSVILWISKFQCRQWVVPNKFPNIVLCTFFHPTKKWIQIR